MIKSYDKMPANSLIIYGLYLATKEGKGKCSFEKLTEECFVLFPKAFELSGYNWPDSRKLDRPLRGLKKRKVVVGNNKYLSLTAKGKKEAEEIQKHFRQTKLII